MAIYHFHVTQISRGKGQTAVSAAAYRAGEKLHEGEVDAVHKAGVVVNDEDMCGEEQGAEEHKEVTPLHGEAALDAEEIETCRGKTNGAPNVCPQLSPCEETAEGDNDNVEGSDETRLA